MRRRLSGLQKRILLCLDAVKGQSGLTAWFEMQQRLGNGEIVTELTLPGQGGNRTDDNATAISRALRRLEQRGLIVRATTLLGLRGKPRTLGFVLTPAGKAVVELIKAGQPVEAVIGKKPKTEVDP
jgi:hypothetical protein